MISAPDEHLRNDAGAPKGSLPADSSSAKEQLRTDDAYEKEHLSTTLEVVRTNCASYEEQARTLKADVEEMTEHFHDGDVEIWVTLNNTITLYENVASAFARNERASRKPYFGRIIFTNEEGKTESLYIGRAGINKSVLEQVVTDWRAPISNAYYENGLGQTVYYAPDGSPISIDLSLKRTYDIADGELTGWFDSDVGANDELLNKYLARNKQAVLSEIIATIQKEQNDIIRKSPFHNVIVQGVAGSGKTTVAMHRISYILYNFNETVRPSDFYIIGSNRMLLNYITGVLPELDVDGVSQMTMEQLFTRLLYEDWSAVKYSICSPDDIGNAAVRCTGEWYAALCSFCNRIEESMIPAKDIYLNPDCFVEGIKDGKSGVFDRSDNPGSSHRESVRLMRGSSIAHYIHENPRVSVQSKIAFLNSQILDNAVLAMTNKGISYTYKEQKAIKSHFKTFLGPNEFKGSIFKLYDAFLSEHPECSHRPAGFKHSYDVYDLAALAYIYKRIKETEIISEAHHIIIDEAQDYGMMAYKVLDYCIRDCTYTIMGDTSQNIRYDNGLNNWSELRALLCSSPRDSFCTLRKSYRNTVEISEFATDILKHGRFEIYPVEPIIRHGNKPSVLKVARAEMFENIARICREWQAGGLETIAVVCRDDITADKLHTQLGQYIELLENDPERAEFGAGIMVLPLRLTKGLEFDCVLLYEPSRTAYPVDDRHAKLLYVAATRALHELTILYSDTLTGLIEDPVPADSDSYICIADSPSGFDGNSTAGAFSPNGRPLDKVITASDEQYSRDMILAKAASRIQKPDNPDAASNNIPADSSRNAGAGLEKSNAATGKADAVANGNEQRIFLTTPHEDLLKVEGHSAVSLAVRWVSKQNDGIFLQSRYGVMRILPISPTVVRFSFAKGTSFTAPAHGRTKEYAMFKKLNVRDSSKALDISTKEMNISIDKALGCLSIRDNAGKEFFKTRRGEAFYISQTPPGRSFVYFEPKSSDEFRVYSAPGDTTRYVGRNKSVYTDASADSSTLLMLSGQYSILLPSDGNAVFCDVAAFGTFLMTQSPFLDFYVIKAAPDDASMLTDYRRLTTSG